MNLVVNLIYHHTQRSLAEKFAQEHARDFISYELAPLGYEVGSSQWITQVVEDIKAADVVVVLMTPEGQNDEWVERRINLAQRDDKRILTVLVSGDHESSVPFSLIRTQYVDFRSELKNEHLLHVLERFYHKKHSTIAQLSNLDVFISYSSSDSDFAVKFVADLRARGFKVWRDKDSIPKGASWDSEIQKALNTCTHVLFIATPTSIASQNVLDEIGFALNKGKVVIPILLVTCELPLRVHRAQWIDFRENYASGIAALMNFWGVGT